MFADIFLSSSLSRKSGFSHLHYFWCTSTGVFTIFPHNCDSATHLALSPSFLRWNHVIFTVSQTLWIMDVNIFPNGLTEKLCLSHWILLVSTFRNHFLGIWCTCGCNKDEILISYLKSVELYVIEVGVPKWNLSWQQTVI